MSAMGLRKIPMMKAAIQRVRELHNADGFRFFPRNRKTGSLPSPIGEAYCTHCQYPAPCPTIKALEGEPHG